MPENPHSAHRKCGAPDVPESVIVVSRPPRNASLDTKKKINRRTTREYSQRFRHAAQMIFMALNVYLGTQFYLWVRYLEHGGHGIQVSRPPGIEGWLPIVGLMNTAYFVATGRVPAIHPAAMFLFMAFVLISLLFKRAFCSWLCPIGTVSEWLWRAGTRLFGRTFRLAPWIDIPLRGTKYLVLGFFVFSVGALSAAGIRAFMHTPFGLVADVKLLDFFREAGLPVIETLAALVVLSMVVQNFWCRYLCPYGALMGIVSLLSPLKVRRDAQRCIDCGKCARACPSGLAVDRLPQVRSPECIACMRCVASCPVERGLQFAAAPRNAVDPALRWRGRVAGPATTAAAITIVFVGMVLVAQATGHWQTHVLQRIEVELVRHADAWTH